MNIHSLAEIMTQPSAAPVIQDNNPARSREDEILDRIRSIFAEKGFDGASMQELARAAGMSVGNFYRYFPSKAAMVEALISRDLAEVNEKFACIAAAPDPLQALRCGLHERVAEGCAALEEERAMWAEITAAAHRRPEIGGAVNRLEQEISGYLCRAFGLAAGLSPEVAERRFGAHARTAITLVRASALMSAGAARGPDTELTVLLQRMVDVILEDVRAAGAAVPKEV